MSGYGRIRRDKSALGTGSLFGRKRPNYRLMFYIFWILAMAGMAIVVHEIGTLQPRVAAMFEPPPTATPIPGEYARRALAAYKEGNLNEAVNNYRQAAKLSPNNVDILYELVRLLIYRSFGDVRDLVSDIPEAQQWAEKAIAAAPNSAKAYAIHCYAMLRADRSLERSVRAEKATWKSTRRGAEPGC